MNKTSLLELARKLNIPRRNYLETKEELEEAIKDNMLAELRNQQAIDQHVYDQKLAEDTMIDKRTGEVLNPEVDSTYWKNKL